jgi:hypothetical protein
MRLQALSEFSQSPGGISTWAMGGALVATILVAVVALAAKRKAAAIAAKTAKKLASPIIHAQRNPLTSVRGPLQPPAVNRFQAHKLKQSFAPINTAAKLATSPILAPKPSLATSPALNTLLQAYSKPITSTSTAAPQRMITRSLAPVNARADLRTFQATPVRQIRTPSAQARAGRLTIPNSALKPPM